MDERSLVVKKQKQTSEFLRNLDPKQCKLHQVELPEDTNWRLQESRDSENEENALQKIQFEVNPAITSYR